MATSEYRLNADYGLRLGNDLAARAAVETDPLHRRRLLREAETNLAWAALNHRLDLDNPRGNVINPSRADLPADAHSRVEPEPATRPSLTRSDVRWSVTGSAWIKGLPEGKETLTGAPDKSSP
jgi:hypothetical protein